MGINSAMLAGSSGLRANASVLAAISDNISNVNTVGFKRLRSDFSALMTTESAGSGHNAAGVSTASKPVMQEQGALQASKVSTHLAISGNGFFIVRELAADATTDDAYLFSRAGQFQPDGEGYLRNSAGHYLYGVREFDSIASSPTDLQALEPVRVVGVGGAAQATSRMSLSANLRASQPVSAAAATYNPQTSNMASGNVSPDFQSTVQIYDSLGGLHNLTLSFLKSANPNTWHVEIHVQPESEITNGANLANGQLTVGDIVFNSNGEMDAELSTLPNSLTIGASGSTPDADGASWAQPAGAQGTPARSFSEQIISLDMVGALSITGLTQYDSPSTVGQSEIDGVSFGALSSVEIDETGTVRANFTNGLSRNIFKIPVATFPNQGGLIALPGGVFQAGSETGSLTMKGAGDSGAGQIRSRSLESSTVDLAKEFSDLIITQRAYSASSKIIMTADDMLDELIRLKR